MLQDPKTTPANPPDDPFDFDPYHVGREPWLDAFDDDEPLPDDHDVWIERDDEE